MSRYFLTTVAATMLAIFTPGSARAQAADAGLMLESAAPSATVETLDGKRVELSAFYTGKPVVLEFWATWCPLCRQLEKPLQAAREKYAGKVTFVSVGVHENQTPEKQKAYAAERHLGGEFVFDRDGKAVAAFKVTHTSYIVVINAENKVVYTGVGADQDVAAAIAKAFPMQGKMTNDMK